MSRFAFSEPSIGSQTTRVGPPPLNVALAELLRDEREALVELLEPSHDAASAAASIAVVSSPPTPSCEHGLALDAGRQLGEHGLDVRRPRRGRPRARASQRVEEEAGDQLREEVGRLLRQHLAAARVGEDVLDPRRAHQVRDRRLAVAGRAAAPRRRRACRDPVVAQRVDELDVEQARLGPRTSCTASRVTSMTPARRRRARRAPRGVGRGRVSLEPPRLGEDAVGRGRSRGPGRAVETSTTSICALAGVPSSSWKASAVS